MARPQKEGLDYFPFNVDFFDDDKMQLIEAEFGEKGLIITIMLLCKIYKEKGYYYQWGEDECLLFSKKAGAGIVPGLVKEVVNGLVRRSFFHKGVFDKFNILTSNGIQKRFFEVAERRKTPTLIKELIVYDNINEVNANINPIYVSINPQRKEKESKEESEAQAPPAPPTEIELKFTAFLDWLKKHAPNVLKMREPFTIEQYEKLQTDFPGQNHVLTEVLKAMHNKPALVKNYTSANLTLRSWARMRNDKDPPVIQITEDRETIKKHAAAIADRYK